MFDSPRERDTRRDMCEASDPAWGNCRCFFLFLSSVLGLVCRFDSLFDLFVLMVVLLVSFTLFLVRDSRGTCRSGGCNCAIVAEEMMPLDGYTQVVICRSVGFFIFGCK